MDLGERIANIHTFAELQTVFEYLVSNNQVEKNKEYVLMGYASLISYPAIILTNKNVPGELQSAQWCYELMLKYHKDYLTNIKDGDSLQTVGKTMLLLPPVHALLVKSTEFFEIDSLIQAVTQDFTKTDYNNYNGDHFVTAWKSLIGKGYHGRYAEIDISENSKHLCNSLAKIQLMQLSEENKIYISNSSQVQHRTAISV